MQNRRLKLGIIILMLFACTAIHVYARKYQGLSIVYSHLFYVPIVLSAYWFGLKAVAVSLYLSLIILFGGFLERSAVDYSDIFRSLIMFFVSLICIKMAELIDFQKKKLVVSESFYRTIVESGIFGYVILDNSTKIHYVNGEFEKLSGVLRQHVEGNMYLKDFFLDHDLEKLFEFYNIRMTDYSGNEHKPLILETKFVTADDVLKDVMICTDKIKGTDKWILSIHDITQLKELKKEKEDLIKKLEEALTKVLSGFIPICANCKKIRDQNGNWLPPEHYISQRSEAQFSHGLCPECKEKLYGQFLRSKT